MARRRCQAPNTAEDFPRAFLDWTSRNPELLNALLALRRLGPEGHQAVEAALAVRRIGVLRSSWQLWAALVEGEGKDAEGILLEKVPLDVLERVRHALWGDPWPEVGSGSPSGRPRLRVVASKSMGAGRS